jgi:hypothetical protein
MSERLDKIEKLMEQSIEFQNKVSKGVDKVSKGVDKVSKNVSRLEKIMK